MRFHSKGLFFKCVLLQLVIEDSVGVERKLERYSDDDPNFNNSYERKFLVNIGKVISEGDEEAFKDECTKLSNRTTMDKHLTAILVQIKSKLSSPGAIQEDYNPL